MLCAPKCIKFLYKKYTVTSSNIFRTVTHFTKKKSHILKFCAQFQKLHSFSILHTFLKNRIHFLKLHKFSKLHTYLFVRRDCSAVNLAFFIQVVVVTAEETCLPAGNALGEAPWRGVTKGVSPAASRHLTSPSGRPTPPQLLPPPTHLGAQPHQNAHPAGGAVGGVGPRSWG